MSDQEKARIAASRHFDDLYSRWLVGPSPGNRFLNDRYGEGFRTPASGAGRARHGEAGVRKPPKEETAFRKRRWRRSCDLWGFEDRRLSAARS
jgi:hypothetical protein